MGEEPEHQEHRERVEDLRPEVRRLEGVAECLEDLHAQAVPASIRTSFPPADSIFARAVAEARCAWTSSAEPRAPFPRIFTRAVASMSPFAASVSGETLPSTAYVGSCSTLTATNSVRKRFLKPRSFGTRMCSGVCPPSNHPGRPGPVRASWPFVPRPAVVPCPAAVPRPSRRVGLRDPLGGRRSWVLIGSPSLRRWRRDARRGGASRAAPACPRARRAGLSAAGRAPEASGERSPSHRSRSCAGGSRAGSRDGGLFGPLTAPAELEPAR